MILYKYLPPERASMLDQLGMRLTQPSLLNDPFECLPRLKISHKSEQELKKLWELVAQKRYRTQTCQEPRGTGFSLYREKCLENLDNWLQEAQSNLESEAALEASLRIQEFMDISVGVICLTECPENALMWSHYAASHSGFVLGFDTSHQAFRPLPTNDVKLGQLRKIEYTDERFLLGSEGGNADFDDYSYLFHKSTDWSYEREWRFIAPLFIGKPVTPHAKSGAIERLKALVKKPRPINVISSPIFIFRLPVSCLKEIIIGFRTKPEIKKLLVSFAQANSEIRVRYASPSALTFQMRIFSEDWW